MNQYKFLLPVWHNLIKIIYAKCVTTKWLITVSVTNFYRFPCIIIWENNDNVHTESGYVLIKELRPIRITIVMSLTFTSVQQYYAFYKKNSIPLPELQAYNFIKLVESLKKKTTVQLHRYYNDVTSLCTWITFPQLNT